MNLVQRSTVALSLLMLGSSAYTQTQWQFNNVNRFVAVADIHGAYDAFESILRKSEVIDDALNWIGGSDHLIIVGDVLDRGPESRRALDLIMRLESAASEAGGAVHLVLGNHELMNLIGDLRYVSYAEYAAFSEDETPDMRTAAFADFPGTIEEFDARYPAGFFAHRQAFAATGEYGAWLLQRPFLLTVNDWAFVHGGLAAASRDLISDDLNATLQQQLHSYTVALDVLTNTGVLSPDANFYEHPELLEAYSTAVAANETGWPQTAETAANIVAELNSAFAFDTDSPTWYRGNVGCSALIEGDRLAMTLEAAGVQHLVVGHTPTRDATVHSHLNDQLYRIDTGMLNDYYGGRGAALIVEGNTAVAVYNDEDSAQAISPQPRRIGTRPDGMTAEALREFLLTADVSAVTELDARWQRVTLRSGDTELDAVFTPKPSRNVQPDLAAWRLDQLLGLNMLPVSVAREIDGDEGTLQYLPAGTITEEQRSAEGLGGGAWCPLADQFGAMYIFDSLIGNTGRTLDRLLYSTENFQLVLLGHDVSFSTSGEKPDHLSALELPLTNLWIERLRSLNEDNVSEALGDVLDRRRLRALLARRDAILNGAGISE